MAEASEAMKRAVRKIDDYAPMTTAESLRRMKDSLAVEIYYAKELRPARPALVAVLEAALECCADKYPPRAFALHVEY